MVPACDPACSRRRDEERHSITVPVIFHCADPPRALAPWEWCGAGGRSGGCLGDLTHAGLSGDTARHLEHSTVEFNAIGAGSIVAPTHVKKQSALVENKLPEVPLRRRRVFVPSAPPSAGRSPLPLLRFGTFKGLSTIASSSTDAYPSTATLDFRGSVYTSSYVAFHGGRSGDRDAPAAHGR